MKSRFVMLVAIVAVAAGIGLGLSGCCDPCFCTGGILTVRLLNNESAGVHVVFFDVYRQDQDSPVASGSFFAQAETPEAYAMREGQIYVFVGYGTTYDVHVYVDENDDQTCNNPDKETRVVGTPIRENQVLEVDYLDFTVVD